MNFSTRRPAGARGRPGRVPAPFARGADPVKLGRAGMPGGVLPRPPQLLPLGRGGLRQRDIGGAARGAPEERLEAAQEPGVARAIERDLQPVPRPGAVGIEAADERVARPAGRTLERNQLGRHGGADHVEVAHPAERGSEPVQLVPQPLDRALSEQWTASPEGGPETADRDPPPPETLQSVAWPEL